MEALSKIAVIKNLNNWISEKHMSHDLATVYRFDIFKGTHDSNGKIQKTKSIGAAYLRDGIKTYTVVLRTFLKDKFYLLPNSKPESKSDFVILTREPAQNIGRKYFWNNVGQGLLLEGINHGLMELSWDVLADGVYMNVHPVNVTEFPEAEKADAAA